MNKLTPQFERRDCVLQITVSVFSLMIALTIVFGMSQPGSCQTGSQERYPIAEQVQRQLRPHTQGEESELRSFATLSRASTNKTDDLPAINESTGVGNTRQSDSFSNNSSNRTPAINASTTKTGNTSNSTLSSNSKAPNQGPIPDSQPQFGEHFFDQAPSTDCDVVVLPFDENDFSPDAVDQCQPFNPCLEMNVYEGKYLNRNQRPAVELGRPFYDFGQYLPSGTLFGSTNLLAPQFLIFGDWRTAAASNVQNGNELTQIATRLNLDIDFKLTATERFHAFVRPFDSGNEFTRVEFDGGDADYFGEFDFEFETGFFEGDLGAIVGGFTGEVLPFDLPFAVGQIPLLLQNGIWLDDAFLGVAATIPARNSRLLDISNFDTTFFWGFSNITSPVFQGDNDAAKMYGTTSFLEMLDGYVEVGYVYLEDRRQLDRSYHNAAIGYTRRYGKRISNSVRVIANAGQDPSTQGANADGLVLLLENSLISRKPYSVVPYFNMFAGFGRPQSVARAAGTGGILRNTGINFETDGLTNYPTLDATANESYGGALGINLLGDQLDHQLVFEFAFLQTMGDDPLRPAVDDQYALGTRYQKPLNNSVLLRADAMYGFLRNDDNISGMRLELRKKF